MSITVACARSVTRVTNKAGADTALVVTPAYYKHEQQRLPVYCRETAGASPLGVSLYSVPPDAGVERDIKPSVILPQSPVFWG